jgi:hypothetical protein
MTLNIELSGAGNRVRFSTVDGRRGRPVVPARGRGAHTVRVKLG